ncbi:MAG TPA: exodeoxyribonuclease VII small subunit [Polyangiaceae bacterium LLY-WYZ-15_(1-7)]|nr:exodeoxyribonuclease VII small subunit [Sandaracinus sp.]HJL00171.1 exodeoxyribonuclease VII small subunit [Polyangiaceae bacterium LLY-WYZ-15_(1-7)]HJL08919.1 exodeoxyribonuclease VII small subunit [Polyangiaceae bacterium LLY-WYZ-15_(1-7)]HJL20911.1 exodeoxyribonuclease VII small subunit [Polyangiaceae bacterium LLY-WYZ-15_(1-7)]HJL38263.1 exodeoxyribonuclease VII small subunit [Polyangiaceae bacterium LLY-WYZ-15_(1-7)]
MSARAVTQKKPRAAAKATAAGPFEDLSYEEVVARLEGVVERLEEGELPLEESLRVFEEGVRLARSGAERLDAAEQRVEALLVRGAEVETRPFEDG